MHSFSYLFFQIDQVPHVDLSQPPGQSQNRGQGPNQDLIPSLNHVRGHVHQLHDHRLAHVQDLLLI